MAADPSHTSSSPATGSHANDEPAQAAAKCAICDGSGWYLAQVAEQRICLCEAGRLSPRDQPTEMTKITFVNKHDGSKAFSIEVPSDFLRR